MSISVVVIREMFELLLSGCVPDLKLDFLLIVADVLDFKVDSYCAQMRGVDVAVHILEDDARFATVGVPDHYEFEQVVLLLVLADHFINYE